MLGFLQEAHQKGCPQEGLMNTGMDEILHHLRHPGVMIPLQNANKTAVSTMVS